LKAGNHVNVPFVAFLNACSFAFICLSISWFFKSIAVANAIGNLCCQCPSPTFTDGYPNSATERSTSHGVSIMRDVKFPNAFQGFAENGTLPIGTPNACVKAFLVAVLQLLLIRS
jgi:hypothetical protein